MLDRVLILFLGLVTAAGVLVLGQADMPWDDPAPRRPSQAGDAGNGAQPDGPDRTFGQRPPGGFMGGDPFGLEQVKSDIRSSDEEWKVIGPMVRKVAMAKMAAEAALDGEASLAVWPGRDDRERDRGRGPGGPGGPPGNDSFRGPSDNASGFGPGGGGRFGPPPGGFGPPPDGFGPPGGFPPGPPPDGFGPPGGFGPPDGPASFRTDRFAGPTTRPAGAATQPAMRRGGFGRGPGGPPPFMGGPSREWMQAAAELQAVLSDPKATEEQIRQKLTALRALRAKTQAALLDAQKELVELLTPDQEAALVSRGYLD